MADRRYFVAADARLPDGKVLLHSRLSRPIQRVSTCRRVLKRIQRTSPAAYMLAVTHFR